MIRVRRPHPRVLLVEGATDLRVIPELVEKGSDLEWELQGRRLVDIEVLDGVEHLTPTLFSDYLKRSGLETLGMVIDADEDAGAAWQKACGCLAAWTSSLPGSAPAEGFVGEANVAGRTIRIGIWIMPDNTSAGMLETLLHRLVDDADPLWVHATNSTDAAHEHGAGFKPPHRDKARVHAWLAWQDEPGAQLHEAVKFKLLDASRSAGQRFIAWFRRLYGV